MKEPTDDLIAQHLARGIPTKTAGGGNWSGVSSAKAQKVLGFRAQFSWESTLQI
jgi:hypothetical protein